MVPIPAPRRPHAERVSQFMSFLTWAGYLLRTTVPQEGPSIVTPFVNALLTEHATALSGLLATFWQRRHDFPSDPDYIPSSRFRGGNRDDTFGGAMYSFCLSLDTLAELQGRYVYLTIRRPRLYLKYHHSDRFLTFHRSSYPCFSTAGHRHTIHRTKATLYFTGC